MPQWTTSTACLFVALSVPACGSDASPQPDPRPQGDPISVTPEAPKPSDTITVRTLAVYGAGRPGESGNYHFNLAGPTGPDCRDSFKSAIGMHAWDRHATERGGEVVVRRYYPTRTDGYPLTSEPGATWCPGTYDGAVEWRKPGSGKLEQRELPNGVVVWGKLLGTYSFEIPG